MSFQKIIIVILLISPLLFISCSDTPTSLGSILVEGDQVNLRIIDSSSDSVFQSTNNFKQVISLGNSVTLFVGKSANIEASTLIRFLLLIPDSLRADFISGSINVQSATVELHQRYSFGSGLLDFTGHNITSSWQSNSFNADSLPLLTYEQNNIITSKNLTDSLNTLSIEPQLIQSWLNAAADTNITDPFGMFLKPDPSSQKIAGYGALTTESEEIPRIKIVIEKPGIFVDTLDFISSTDVSVVTGEKPLINPENSVVQGGLAVRSKLYFDLSFIPENAVISSAELELTIDTTETLTGSPLTNSILAYFLADTTGKDSTSGSLDLQREGNLFKGTVTVFVKRWIDTGNNLGLLLTVGDELNGLEIFAFKGSNAPVVQRPKLKIIYTSLE